MCILLLFLPFLKKGSSEKICFKGLCCPATRLQIWPFDSLHLWLKHSFHLSVSLGAKRVCFFFPLFLHSSTLLQAPSWIPLFSLYVFKIKWCSAQACLLGGSDITSSCCDFWFREQSTANKSLLGPVNLFFFPCLQNISGSTSVCTEPPVPGNAFAVVLSW